jgi:hypothetical protein
MLLSFDRFEDIELLINLYFYRVQYEQMPFYLACKWGDKEVVGLLLDRGADVNKKDWVCIHRNSHLSDCFIPLLPGCNPCKRHANYSFLAVCICFEF